MGTTLFLILAGIVVVGGFMARDRVQRVADGDEEVVGDDLLRRILEEGEAPPSVGDGEWDEDGELDEERARREEDRFWNEEWDEPEEWGG